MIILNKSVASGLTVSPSSVPSLALSAPGCLCTETSMPSATMLQLEVSHMDLSVASSNFF